MFLLFLNVFKPSLLNSELYFGVSRQVLQNAAPLVANQASAVTAASGSQPPDCKPQLAAQQQLAQASNVTMTSQATATPAKTPTRTLASSLSVRRSLVAARPDYFYSFRRFVIFHANFDSTEIQCHMYIMYIFCCGVRLKKTRI